MINRGAGSVITPPAHQAYPTNYHIENGFFCGDLDFQWYYVEDSDTHDSWEDCQFTVDNPIYTDDVQVITTVDEIEIVNTVMSRGRLVVNMSVVSDHIDMRSNRMMTKANLNGGSALDGNKCAFSELLAYEVLNIAWRAQLVRTECEIIYRFDSGKKTDMIVAIDNTLVAISVTRAMYDRRNNNTFDACRARSLLNKKIQGIFESNINVLSDVKDNRWCHHILFIWCEDAMVEKQLMDQLNSGCPPPDNSTIVLCRNPNSLNSRLY